MKKVPAVTMSLILLATGLSFAQMEKPAVVQAETAKLIEVGNKICPVSHEEVGKDGMTPAKVTYKGKVYNLCCHMCEKDFKSNPEMFIDIIEKEMSGQK